MPKAMTRWRCARRILACAVMMTIVLAPTRQSNAQQDDAPAATSQDIAQIIRSAKTQLRDGEASAALFLFEEALRARPTSDTALSGRIESLIALGKWAPALEALNARVARAPTDPGRLLDRAFVRLSIASLETDLSHLHGHSTADPGTHGVQDVERGAHNLRPDPVAGKSQKGQVRGHGRST